MENKGIKSNLANALKTILDQRETIETNLKLYINQLIENTQSESRSQLQFIETDIKATKIENGKYHLEAMKKVKEFKEELESFKNMKQEIGEEWIKEKGVFIEGRKWISEMEKEMKKTESTHVEIIEAIKVKYFK